MSETIGTTVKVYAYWHDCGHLNLDREAPCSICADLKKKYQHGYQMGINKKNANIEKQVKLARVEELRAIAQALDTEKRIESVVKHLTARLAELEKV